MEIVSQITLQRKISERLEVSDMAINDYKRQVRLSPFFSLVSY